MKLENNTIYQMSNGDYIFVTELSDEDRKEQAAPEDAKFQGRYVDNRGWNWYREDGQVCGGYPDHYLNLVEKAKIAEADPE